MRSKEQIQKEIDRLKSDERLSYPPASVFSNAPLALIQVELAAQLKALTWVLLDMDEDAMKKARQQMKAAGPVSRITDEDIEAINLI